MALNNLFDALQAGDKILAEDKTIGCKITLAPGFALNSEGTDIDPEGVWNYLYLAMHKTDANLNFKFRYDERFFDQFVALCDELKKTLTPKASIQALKSEENQWRDDPSKKIKAHYCGINFSDNLFPRLTYGFSDMGSISKKDASYLKKKTDFFTFSGAFANGGLAPEIIIKIPTKVFLKLRAVCLKAVKKLPLVKPANAKK